MVYYVFCNHVRHILFISLNHIIDATVGFMPSQITVSEEDGTAHVCVEITRPDIPCPVEYPFNLVITTADGTAGNDDAKGSQVNWTLQHSQITVFQSCM